MGTIQQLLGVILTPSAFYQSVKNVEDIREVIIPFSTLMLVVSIISSLSVLFIDSSKLIISLVQVPFVLLKSIIDLFILAGIIHFFVYLFGGAGYIKTLKAVGFGVLVTVPYNIIAVLLSWTLIESLQNAGTISGLSGSSLAVFFLIIAIAIAGVVHSLLVISTGLSFYHNISRKKALISIVLFPLIIIGLFLLFFLGMW